MTIEKLTPQQWADKENVSVDLTTVIKTPATMQELLDFINKTQGRIQILDDSKPPIYHLCYVNYKLDGGKLLLDIDDEGNEIGLELDDPVKVWVKLE